MAATGDDLREIEGGQPAGCPVLGTPWRGPTVDSAGGIGNGEGELSIVEPKQAYDCICSGGVIRSGGVLVC